MDVGRIEFKSTSFPSDREHFLSPQRQDSSTSAVHFDTSSFRQKWQKARCRASYTHTTSYGLFYSKKKTKTIMVVFREKYRGVILIARLLSDVDKASVVTLDSSLSTCWQ